MSAYKMKNIRLFFQDKLIHFSVSVKHVTLSINNGYDLHSL